MARRGSPAGRAAPRVSFARAASPRQVTVSRRAESEARAESTSGSAASACSTSQMQAPQVRPETTSSSRCVPSRSGSAKGARSSPATVASGAQRAGLGLAPAHRRRPGPGPRTSACAPSQPVQQKRSCAGASRAPQCAQAAAETACRRDRLGAAEQAHRTHHPLADVEGRLVRRRTGSAALPTGRARAAAPRPPSGPAPRGPKLQRHVHALRAARRSTPSMRPGTGCPSRSVATTPSSPPAKVTCARQPSASCRAASAITAL